MVQHPGLLAQWKEPHCVMCIVKRNNPTQNFLDPNHVMSSPANLFTTAAAADNPQSAEVKSLHSDPSMFVYLSVHYRRVGLSHSQLEVGAHHD